MKKSLAKNRRGLMIEIRKAERREREREKSSRRSLFNRAQVLLLLPFLRLVVAMELRWPRVRERLVGEREVLTGTRRQVERETKSHNYNQL